jgi:hypothetical protein
MRKELLISRFQKLGYKLITSDSYNIAKRIEKYDSDLVLFFNPARKRYEIHSCTFFPSSRPTYVCGSPYLDAELILYMKRADNRTEFGFREKMDLLDREERQREIEKSKKEQDIRDNVISSIKKEDKGVRHFYMGG